MGGPLEPGIEFEVRYRDEHLTELQVGCSNGRFSGQTRVCLNHDRLPEVAEGLTGFPSRRDDSRTFELGPCGPNQPLGGLQLHFHCLDQSVMPQSM